MSNDMADTDMVLRGLAQAIVDTNKQCTGLGENLLTVSCRHCGEAVKATVGAVGTGMVDPIHKENCAVMLAECTLAVLEAKRQENKSKSKRIREIAQSLVDHGLGFESGSGHQNIVRCRHCNECAPSTGSRNMDKDLEPYHRKECTYMSAKRTLEELDLNPKKYRHLFSLGFLVTTPHKAEDVTAQELLDALHTRFLDLDNTDTDDIVEACGPPDDTEEVE